MALHYWTYSLASKSSNENEPIQNKGVRESGKPHLVSYLAEITQKDPDLGETVKVWPGLPEHIKAAIMALVKTRKGDG